MDDFKLLIFNTHEFFFGLVALVFAFILAQDAKIADKNTTTVGRKFLVLILGMIGVGVLGTLLFSWEMNGLFLALEFTLLILFSIIHPKYAVGFLVFLLLSRPWETMIDPMMESMPRDISYLVILSIIGHKILKKDLFFRFNLGTFAILFFALWMFFSAFLSNNSEFAIQDYFESFSKGIIIFLIIQNGLETKRDMLPAKIALVLAILEKCFVSFTKTNMSAATSIVDTNARLESVGILANSNDIAAIFVLAIPFCIYLILKTRLKPFSWIAAIVVVSLMSWLIWQSQSRGAILGLMAVAGAWFFTRIKTTKKIILCLVLTVLAGVSAIGLMSREAEDIEGSTENRKIYWMAGANMAVRNPIFGVGYAGFQKNLPAYAIGGDLGSEGEHMTAHSSWILALAEGGLIGLLSFMMIWIYALVSSWKIRIENPEYFCAIVGYGVTVTFLSHTYLLYPYILLALAIAHAHAQSPEKKLARQLPFRKLHHI